MFAPHSAKIDIERCEPELSDVIKVDVQKRNTELAGKILRHNLLKKDPKDPVKSKRRILAATEKEARMERLEKFCEYWAKWAFRYRSIEMSHWKPKTTGQMSCMEKIKEICAKNEVHLDLFIGCVWRAYRYRKAVPTVQIAVAYADVFYKENIDSVYDDLSCDAYIG